MKRSIRNKDTGEIITLPIHYESKRMLVLQGTHNDQDVIVMYSKGTKEFYTPYKRFELLEPGQATLDSLD